MTGNCSIWRDLFLAPLAWPNLCELSLLGLKDSIEFKNAIYHPIQALNRQIQMTERVEKLCLLWFTTWKLIRIVRNHVRKRRINFLWQGLSWLAYRLKVSIAVVNLKDFSLHWQWLQALRWMCLTEQKGRKVFLEYPLPQKGRCTFVWSSSLNCQ